MLEKTLESPLDCKEIKPVNPKGNQTWTVIGKTDAEAETPMLWPPDGKNWLIGKYPDAGKRLKAGGEGEDRRWDGWMVSPTWWTWVWASSSKWVMERKAWRAAVHRVAKSQTPLSDWTDYITEVDLGSLNSSFLKGYWIAHRVVERAREKDIVKH